MQETQETQIPSLGWEDPLEEEVATHSSSFAWEIPWTEELRRLTVQRVADNQTQLNNYARMHKSFNVELAKKFVWVFSVTSYGKT